MNTMKHFLFAFAVLLLALPATTLGHDPRSVTREYSHTLLIEKEGRMLVSYKSLHWNEPSYQAAKRNDQMRAGLNRMWKKIGMFGTDFDIEIGGVDVPKGTYDLGISFDASDNFKLVLKDARKEVVIPLQVTAASPVIDFLTFDIMPGAAADSFIIEGRSGKFRGTAEIKVPSLAPHEHPGQ